MTKDIVVAYGIDVDAVGGWLGSYGGEGSPCDIVHERLIAHFRAHPGVRFARFDTVAAEFRARHAARQTGR